MADASGSIAFLGAARLQGYWNAATNNATSSGKPGSHSGVYAALFKSGSSTAGGYSSITNIQLLLAIIGKLLAQEHTF